MIRGVDTRQNSLVISQDYAEEGSCHIIPSLFSWLSIISLFDKLAIHYFPLVRDLNACLAPARYVYSIWYSRLSSFPVASCSQRHFNLARRGTVVQYLINLLQTICLYCVCSPI